MAGTATVSPFISIKRTNLNSSAARSRDLSFPPRSLLLRHHSHRTIHNGQSRLISIPYAKLNSSTGEERFGEIDEGFFYNDVFIGEDDDSEDDVDTESSLDLLFRFLHSLFKKVSKRVRKASRSVLPAVIPPQLVSFGVDGVLLLASVSILKALLEVICTIGSTVFVVILLLRVIWAAISYFQSSGNDFNQSGILPTVELNQ